MDEDKENFIEFEVVLAKYNSRKRRRMANDNDLEKDDHHDDQQSLNNEGRWSKEEIFLFSKGVNVILWRVYTNQKTFSSARNNKLS